MQSCGNEGLPERELGLLIAPMIERLHRQHDLESALHMAIVDAVALHGAEFGCIQLCRRDESLMIVAHQGLSQSFLESFGRVAPDDGTACARARRERKTILIRDVENDDEFRPFIDFARSARFRSVISSPLMVISGSCVGVLSVHFSLPHVPREIEITALEAYCQAATDYFIIQTRGGDLREHAERLHTRLLQLDGQRRNPSPPSQRSKAAG
jgi:GAF domain-containing protein